VHKDSVTAWVRVPDGHGGRQVVTRRFTTTTAGLLVLAEWLASYQVTRDGVDRVLQRSRSGSCSRARSSAGC
jgi:hypothetical protein